MSRDFDKWLSGFRDSIADYKYYVDFEKVSSNVDSVRIELNILNSLIGSKNIELDFERIVARYPETLRCIPILLAKRGTEIKAMDADGEFCYDFNGLSCSIDQYKVFMRKTGLFDLMEHHIIHNLFDYVTGVEVGLDSNGRKNRGGHLMEHLVESYLVRAGLVEGETYFKEMYIHEIEGKWGIDLSAISNNGQAEKRFDFVVRGGEDKIYGIETNFYSGSGSKLNETARSYKTIAQETRDLPYFDFVWITDGQGWISARRNLKETFDVLENLYNIKDLEEGMVRRVLI